MKKKTSFESVISATERATALRENRLSRLNSIVNPDYHAYCCQIKLQRACRDVSFENVIERIDEFLDTLEMFINIFGVQSKMELSAIFNSPVGIVGSRRKEFLRNRQAFEVRALRAAKLFERVVVHSNWKGKI